MANGNDTQNGESKRPRIGVKLMERYDKAFDQQVSDLIEDIQEEMDYDESQVQALAWDALGLGNEHREQRELEKKVNEMRCMTSPEERELREKLAQIESQKKADIQQLEDKLTRIKELKGEYDGTLCRNYGYGSRYNADTTKQTHYNDAKKAAKESLYPQFAIIEELRKLAKQGKRDLTFCNAPAEIKAVWDAFEVQAKKIVEKLSK